MRLHDHDGEGEAGLRPRGDRSGGGPGDLAYRAAAAGRADALGPGGLLDLQRAVGNAGVGAMLEEPAAPDVVPPGGGRPLDPDTRADMEARLGHDFGDVRVHTDAAAHDSARSLNAQAYTTGSDVVFQRDRYDPASAGGRLMLAHELTHVVQQRSGPVDGTDAGNGVRVSDPSDRFERAAVANAERAMAAPASSVQRDETPPEEEEEAAAPSVQRQDEDQEEEPAS